MMDCARVNLMAWILLVKLTQFHFMNMNILLSKDSALKSENLFDLKSNSIL